MLVASVTNLFGSDTTVQAQDCTRNATVVAGDTCDAISKKYASPTFQFALANPDIDAACSNLMIGAEVCLGQRGTDCSKVHVVVGGE